MRRRYSALSVLCMLLFGLINTGKLDGASGGSVNVVNSAKKVLKSAVSVFGAFSFDPSDFQESRERKEQS